MLTIHEPQQHVPIHAWTDKLNAECRRQLQRLAAWRRLAAPIAVMPDVHLAENLCVGTVVATGDCILPTSIGQDLGCGMNSRCYEFAAAELSRDLLERIVEQTLDAVPVGRRSHRGPQALPPELNARLSSRALAHARDWLGSRHFGTLGGGNHFIELQRDLHGRLWVTVHSGSRGIGAALAAHHGQISLKEPGAPLPHFEAQTPGAQDFLHDHDWALVYARANRERMQLTVAGVLEKLLGKKLQQNDGFDVPHNLIRFEAHAGRQLWIHRKGAMPAHAGERGIVPGSMGTASYIVEGRGHAAAYASCSHGAGRQLSRTEAAQRISLNDLRRQMRDVVYSQRRKILEAMRGEAPGAYKEIKRVLALEEELVTPVMRLAPLAVIKGD